MMQFFKNYRKRIFLNTWLMCCGCFVFVLSCQRPVFAEERAGTSAPGTCDSAYPDAEGNMTIVCRGLNDDQIRMLANLDITKLLQPGALPKTELKSEPKSEPKSVPTPVAKPFKVSSPGKETIIYDYRGFKTSSITGFLAEDPGESAQYQKLLTLQKAGEWKKLLKEAAREIKKVPDWLTPYAFKGVALQHLGNTKEAIEALSYVAQRSIGNPDYNQVRLLLDHLNAKAAGLER